MDLNSDYFTNTWGFLHPSLYLSVNVYKNQTIEKLHYIQKKPFLKWS